MKKFYTISELANFFQVSRQTLIYYDKIDIFKPDYKDEENGYRYYSRDRFSDFSFLLMLKNSGFSLNDIKKYFESANPNESKIFLEDKLDEIDRKIKELENSKLEIKKKVKELDKILDLKDPQPEIKELDKIFMIKVDIDYPYDNLEFEKSIKKLKKIVSNEKEIKFFSSIRKENLEKVKVNGANYLGIILKEERGNFKVEKNRYVSIIHADLYDKIYFSYLKLFEYIERNNFKIIGDSLEFSSTATLFLGKGAGGYMEILIPVEKKEEKPIDNCTNL